MIKQHFLVDTDTLLGISNTYGVTWQKIVDFNDLDYPYIVTNKDYLINNAYASGFLYAVRKGTKSEVTVKAGTRFKARGSTPNGVVREYELVNDVTFPVGTSEAYFFIRCTLKGSFGNTLSNTITEVSNLIADIKNQPTLLMKAASASAVIEFSTLTNNSPLANGRDMNIKVTGEFLFIPTEDQVSIIKAPVTIDTILESIGGTDIYFLNKEPAFTSGGDIQCITGIDNIKQAVIHRLLTERGEYPLHPEYGTNIPSIIGTAQTPYTKKLIELEILDALAQEDRIEGVTMNAVEIDGTVVRVDFDYTLAGSDARDNIKLLLNYRRGL